MGAAANEWRFTGEQRDPQANRNFYYLRARYYDPALGRFLSQDPIRGGNLYAYVGNNPANLVDPYGLWGIPGFVDSWDCASDPIGCGEEAVTTVYQQVVKPAGNAGYKTADRLLRAGGDLAKAGVEGGSQAINAVSTAVGSAVDFLGSCEGKLLAGGLVMIAVGGGMIGLYYWSASAALAAGTEAGVHAAVQLGWLGAGGGVLGTFGLASVLDACLHSDERYFGRDGSIGGANIGGTKE